MLSKGREFSQNPHKGATGNRRLPTHFGGSRRISCTHTHLPCTFSAIFFNHGNLKPMPKASPSSPLLILPANAVLRGCLHPFFGWTWQCWSCSLAAEPKARMLLLAHTKNNLRSLLHAGTSSATSTSCIVKPSLALGSCQTAVSCPCATPLACTCVHADCIAPATMSGQRTSLDAYSS